MLLYRPLGCYDVNPLGATVLIFSSRESYIVIGRYIFVFNQQELEMEGPMLTLTLK